MVLGGRCRSHLVWSFRVITSDFVPCVLVLECVYPHSFHFQPGSRIALGWLLGAWVTALCQVLVALTKAPSWNYVSSCWDRLFPLGLLQRGERTAEPWKWRGTAGVSVAAGPGLPGGGGPFLSQPGSYVPNLCESLRNACLLCIGGFREQNLNYDVTITILASNICFVSV